MIPLFLLNENIANQQASNLTDQQYSEKFRQQILKNNFVILAGS